MFATTKKKVVTLLAILGIAAVSTAAYAYWTAGGTGTGSGTAGDITAITVNQTKVLTPMFPGDTAQTLNGTFNNPNTGNVFVATVTASIASVTKATGAPSGTCDPHGLHARQRDDDGQPGRGGRPEPGHLERRHDQVQQQGQQPERLQERDGQPRLRQRVAPPRARTPR